MPQVTIPDNYDTAAIITADSSPEEEFKIWEEHAAGNPEDWSRDEFTLADFQDYIEELK